MKIFASIQISEIDQYTIKNEPITQIDLIERASFKIVNWLIHNIPYRKKLLFFAGPGDNGADTLVVARLISEYEYESEVYLLSSDKPLKESVAISLNRLEKQGKVKISVIDSDSSIPEIPSDAVVLDGLFGSGLNRPLEGIAEKIVAQINSSGALVVAIDMPSGLFCEDNSHNDLSKVVIAAFTLSFQFPKLSFFFPEHSGILGKWEVLPIGLHRDAIEQINTPFNYLSKDRILGLIKQREKFSHKGNYGHALLISGSYGKMGAAILASRACLRSGAGLLTTHIPAKGYEIMQISVPEAICSIDSSDFFFSDIPDLDPYTAIGVGPGLGKNKMSGQALKKLLEAKHSKIVLDADALNILANERELLDLLPENAVITPHPKEFERLAGKSSDSYTRLLCQMEFSKRYKIIVVLKGAHTCITFPNGEAWFNTTGDPGMATAGSGDVLTGVILALLAQNYTPDKAAQIGVFIHGLAGDIAALQKGEISLIAGDIIDSLGTAFTKKQIL